MDAPKALALTPTCKIHVPLNKMQSLSLNVNLSFQRQVELLIRGTVYFQVVRLLIQCIPLSVVHKNVITKAQLTCLIANTTHTHAHARTHTHTHKQSNKPPRSGMWPIRKDATEMKSLTFFPE